MTTTLKKQLLYLFLLVSAEYLAQGQKVSQQGLWDEVKDNYGSNYDLKDLSLYGAKFPNGSQNTTSAPPTNSCLAGYFTLYYAPGSYLDNSLPARNVLCEAFSNLSGLISSSLSAGTINIFCADEIGAPIGKAGSFYVFPLAPTNINQGVIYNQVHKSLITGVDAFQNLPITFLGSNNFYHGYLYIKSNASLSPNSWNLNMNTTAIGTTEYDLYSVVLHEAAHLLGISSLISVNGQSSLPVNYYNKFDLFLCDANNNPLIVPTSTSCPTGALVYTAATSAISPSTCSGTVVSTNTSNCNTDVVYLSSNENNIHQVASNQAVV